MEMRNSHAAGPGAVLIQGAPGAFSPVPPRSRPSVLKNGGILTFYGVNESRKEFNQNWRKDVRAPFFHTGRMIKESRPGNDLPSYLPWAFSGDQKEA